MEKGKFPPKPHWNHQTIRAQVPAVRDDIAGLVRDDVHTLWTSSVVMDRCIVGSNTSVSSESE